MIFTPEQRITAFRSGEFVLDTGSEQAQGLGGWWPLGVHGGNSKDWDYSLFNNNGTRTNDPTRKAVNHPRYGGIHALDFDGVNNYVDVGDLSIFEVPQGITVSAWARPSISEQTNFSAIVVKEYAATRTAPFISWKLAGHGGAGENVYQFETGHSVSAPQRNEAASTTVPTINEWVHLLGTYDGAVTRLYVNGIEEGTDNAFTSDIIYLDGRLLFGANEDVAELWDGLTDDVRFYNRALSAAEAFNNYNEPWRLVYPLGVRTISFAPVAAGTILPQITSEYYRINA